LIVGCNGIFSDTGNFAWTREFGRRAQIAGYLADSYEYFTDALTIHVWDNKHVEDLERLIESYDVDEVHLVGHSHGCALILGVLNLIGRIESINLVSAAIDPDCNSTGINDAILAGRLGSATFYCSANDDVLKYIATASQWIPLVPDFGNAGYTGPAHGLPQVKVHQWPDHPPYGHSTAVEPAQYDSTFGLILANIKSCQSTTSN